MPLSSAELATLSGLLEQALELTPDERAGWLDALPEVHIELKPWLRHLLAKADAAETDDLLQTLPKLDRGRAPATADHAPGQRVGPYRLIRLLGQGGMGAVWLAERADGALERQVALKLPLLAAQPLMRQRLARERDILAGLEHPHIARLYDAGVDPSGQPYLALEYVEGEAIDAYCETHALDVRTRLELFLQVARAVAYAHAHLVLHRDLKPGNILVTLDGQVRLLDFGIAKLLEDGSAKDTELTQQGGRALTPDYASPEQILGEPLTVASDVYALGVVLYELLAGQRPYRLKRDSRGALEDAVVSVEPQPPSAVVADRAWRRRLRGDLDTIVLKALKKPPAERYPTANAFADDVGRYLAGHPVLAQPDSGWYRARKFALRNRLAVGAVSATLVALVSGVAGTTWQAIEARRERDQALFQAERALAKGNLVDLMLGALGDTERPLTQREILDRSVALVDKQFGKDPRIAIDLLLPIAGQYFTLGDTAKELAVMQHAADIAAASGDPQLIASVACGTVETEVTRNRLDRAREQLRVGLRALAQMSRPELGTTIACLSAQAEVARSIGDLNGALAHLDDAVRRVEQAGRTKGNMYPKLLSQLSVLHAVRGDRRASFEILQRLQHLYDATGRTGSADHLGGQRDQAVALMEWGEFRAAADIIYSIESRWQSANSGQPSPSWLESTRGVLLLRFGNLERAEQVLRVAAGRARAEGNERSALLAEFALTRVLVERGKFDEAASTLAAVEQALPPGPGRYGRITPNTVRAQLLLARGASAEAMRTIEDELTRLGFPAAKDTNALAAALMMGARVHLATGDAQRARHLASAAFAVAERIARDPRRSADVGEALLLLAQAQRRLGDSSGSADSARRGAASLEGGLGAASPVDRRSAGTHRSLSNPSARIAQLALKP